MVIRDYKKTDEQAWLKCRLLSFYDSSYAEDIIYKKPVYFNSTIDLVAVENEKIVGFIEVEIEEEVGDACYLDTTVGGVVWNIGVLPEYRRNKIANKLLNAAILKAKNLNITRFEAWTQDDQPANKWYEKNGFKFIKSYLNVYATHSECLKNDLINDNIGEIFAVRNLNFEVPINRKTEILEKYSKVNEVKLYELKL